MEGSASKEQPIQFTDEHETSLHGEIQKLLGRLGHGHDTRPEAQKSVLSADVAHIIGSTAEGLVRGENSTTRDRVATMSPLRFFLKRLRERRQWK